jgi:hypothetical protein
MLAVSVFILLVLHLERDKWQVLLWSIIHRPSFIIHHLGLSVRVTRDKSDFSPTSALRAYTVPRLMYSIRVEVAEIE